jgi:hypothetical protein
MDANKGHMAARRSSWRKCFAIAAVAAAGSCGGTETGPASGPTPSAIVVVAGDKQTGTVGQALPQPLVIKVTDQSGAAVAGSTVSWTVSTGGGSVSAASNQTDGQGQAQIAWTLGHAAGSNNNTVAARIAGLSVTFTASAGAGSPARLTMTAGNSQTGLVGQTLAQPLVVAVGDQYANPISGVSVSWAVTAGGGSVSASSLTTNAQGQAAVTWTIGPDTGAGKNAVQASASGLAGSSVTFTASGVATMIYTDPAAFQQATASLGTPTIINFDELDASPLNNTIAGRTPFDGSHYAGQGFTFASPGGYPLYIAPGGLFWNASNSLSVGRFPYDTSQSATDVATDDADSLMVTLSPGCAAVSLQLLEIGIGANGTASPADSVKFLDASGNVVQQAAFPRDYTSYRAFLGLVSTTQVVTILVAEQANNGDDVDYDDFTCFHS